MLSNLYTPAFSEEEAKDVWRELAATHDVPLVLIECSMSDTHLHKKRIEAASGTCTAFLK